MIGALRAQLERCHAEIDTGAECAGDPEAAIEAAGGARERARPGAQQFYRGSADGGDRSTPSSMPLATGSQMVIAARVTVDELPGLRRLPRAGI